MTKSENINIPLIIGGLLLITSFVPVPQIIMLHGNGAFLYPFEKILNYSDHTVLNYINLLFGIVFLATFYFSKKIGFKILWAILAVFFFNGFIFLSEMELTKGGDTQPYYLGFIISGILAIIPLLIIGIIKEKKAYT